MDTWSTRGGTVSGIFSAAACAFSMGAVCLTRQAILLEGDKATLTFQMIRETRTAELVVDVDSTIVAADAGAASIKPWWPLEIRVSETERIQRYYMMHAPQVDLRMTWTNDPPFSGGDFDLGVSWDIDYRSEETNEGSDITTLVTTTENERRLEYMPPAPPAVGTTVNQGWASVFVDEEPCPLLFAGPIFNHPNLPTRLELSGSFTFLARTQVPLVEEG